MIPQNIRAAIEVGNIVKVRDWLDRGGDLRAVDEGNKETLLHKAAYYGQVPIMRLLITRGLTPNLQDKMLFTPLHEAARAGQAEAVEYLLSVGADTNIKNSNGSTALDAAMDKGNDATIRALKKQFAKPKWTRNGDELVCLTPKPEIDHTLTEIFNFQSRTYLLITQNDKTNAETSIFRTFSEFGDDALLTQASGQFVALGGKLPDDESRLDKPKPAPGLTRSGLL